MVMTYSHAKVQGQRSIRSKNRVETNEWTDEANYITFLGYMRSVTKGRRFLVLGEGYSIHCEPKKVALHL